MDEMTPLDSPYDERNRCVAAIARFALNVGPAYAWLGRHEEVKDPRETEANPWDPEWFNVVYVELPTGQCSWHIHDRDLPLFAFLKRRDVPWDGHTTADKYKRIDQFANGAVHE